MLCAPLLQVDPTEKMKDYKVQITRCQINVNRIQLSELAARQINSHLAAAKLLR